VVIVDTTVWVDYFRGVRNPETDWLDTGLDRQRLGLTDIILCEVLQGVHDDSAAADVERRLRKLEVFESGGVELATEAARNYRVLRARGTRCARRSWQASRGPRARTGDGRLQRCSSDRRTSCQPSWRGCLRRVCSATARRGSSSSGSSPPARRG